MNKFTAFGRFAAMTALAGSLGLAAMKPASAEAHAYWTSVVGTSGGQQVCGVRTTMTDGGRLALMVVNNEVHMVAYDPRWNVTEGNTVVVTVSVDGDLFRGNATVTDQHTLVLANLSDRFLREFIDGNDMVTDFGGVRWNVDLTGSSNATDDMIGCVREAGSGAPMS
jgi:hypothetical protein